MSTVIPDYHEPTRQIVFNHGMGDCANFAQALPLWLKRGHRLRLCCQSDSEKEPLFRAAGCEKPTSGKGGSHHDYWHPGPATNITLTNDWAENKLAHNLTSPPMPHIGSVEDLWKELLEVKLTLEPQLTDEQRNRVDEFLSPLGCYVALHTRGNTCQGSKNFNTDLEQETYRAILDQTGASLLLLDWDKRVSRLDHRRVVHLSEFGPTRVTELWYLLSRASCVVGVDSGPYHLCRFTDTPCVGVWFAHHPAKFALPRSDTVNVVDKRHGHWNSKRRHSFHLVDVDRITGDVIASCVARLLAGWSGNEVTFDHVLSRLHQFGQEGLYLDREQTYRESLATLTALDKPVIVETGCARSVDDWTAGFSTYVFGWFCRTYGGELHSVDNDGGNCAFAREWSAPFPVQVHESDSLAWLSAYSGKPIDLLYLDSMDTAVEGHAEHCLEEARRALPHLSPSAMVLIDDTPTRNGKLSGKGALAVPFLVGQGWRIHESSGYQVLLQRGDN